MAGLDVPGLVAPLGCGVLIYWLLFLAPAGFALVEPADNPDRRPFAAPAWIFVVAVLVLVIGLRWETGGDWSNYDRMVQAAAWDAPRLTWLDDPGFAALTRLAAESSFGMLAVTCVSGLALTLALVRFCLAQPRPWLCLAVAVPYFVVVLGMGYIRQGIAVSLVLIALAGINHGGALRFALWIGAAALFHSTALALLPLALAFAGGDPRARLAGGAVTVAALLAVAASERAGMLTTNYLNEPMASSGAIVRLAMTAAPALLLIAWRDRFGLSADERRVWLLLAWAAIALFAAALVFPASTAIDRLGLYLLPLQFFVFARAPGVLAGDARTERVLGMAVLALYAAAFFVWLNFAVNVGFWLPYRFFPFEDGACLEC